MKEYTEESVKINLTKMLREEIACEKKRSKTILLTVGILAMQWVIPVCDL